jgi:long-chain acyl-CoA synthetase
MKYQTLGEMFFANREICPDRAAYMSKHEGSWQEVSFSDAAARTEKISAALIQSGISKGDKVALMSANRLEWALVDYATTCLGAVLVPIYPTLMAHQAEYIINNSEAKVIIVSDSDQAAKVDEVRGNLSTLSRFVCMDAIARDGWETLDAFSGQGAEHLQQNPACISDMMKNVSPDDDATIIYTSGTTGEPKGAVLTHKNFLSNIHTAAQLFTVTGSDMFLSFLPLSHVLERMAGHYQATYHSVTVAYAESIEAVPQNILEIKPTIMISVPRLYEKMYAKILENVEMGSGLKRKIFFWAIKVGREYIRKTMYKEPIPSGLQRKRNIAYKLVFHKIYEKLGGRLRFFISGGAPLSAEIAEFFGAAGLLIMEGYGLTETSPLISVNYPENFRFGTVGLPGPDVEVKIAEDGEILARGPNIMKGYYRKPEATAEVIDKNGWFYTGDIGHLDDDGFLVITDRKKNILVTSGGKNIAPQPIENKLVTSKYIEQAVVIGDNRNYCTAVIVCSEEPLMKWAAENNVTGSTSEILTNAATKSLIRAEVDNLTSDLARYETIKDFVLVTEPFTIENEQLTPSLKVKRKVVEKVYAGQIEAMYN